MGNEGQKEQNATGQVRHLKEEHLSGMRGRREHLTEGAPVKEGAFQRDGCTSR